LDFATHKRSGKAQPTWALALLFLILGAGLLGAYLWSAGLITSGNVAKTPNGNGLTSATLPLSVSLTDPLAKAPISSASVQFYTPAGGYVSGCTIASGVCTTAGQSFTSGTGLVANIIESNYITEWIPFTVPFLTAGSGSVTTIPLALYQMKTGSFVFTAQIGTTTVLNGVSAAPFTYLYNFGSTAAQSVTVSFLYKTANEGYINCNQGTGLQYDIINGICQSAVLQITDNSTGLALTGMPRQFSSGSTRYWWSILPDGVCIASTTNGGQGVMTQCSAPGHGAPYGGRDSNTQGSLTEQSVGGSLYGGTATATFTIKQGSVASGSTESLVFTLFINADPNYFAVNNNLGPNAINASTPFTITFKGH
jgi:hypothetical protein